MNPDSSGISVKQNSSTVFNQAMPGHQKLISSTSVSLLMTVGVRLTNTLNDEQDQIMVYSKSKIYDKDLISTPGMIKLLIA